MIHSAHRRPNFRNGRGRMGDAAGLSSLASAGIGAGVSLATAAIGDWMNSIQLSHDADTATTLIVNGLATQLSNLVTAYQSEAPSCANQRAALDAYDQAWAWLQSPAACGNPGYGSAGNRCISDRAPGGKYPWQTYYRDPIANDPRLAGLSCDTSQELLLPSVSGSTYSPTGITAAGQADVTTTPAAVTSPSSSGLSTVAAAGASIVAGIPNILIYAGIGLFAFLLLRPSE